ncbi:uncharacterized protein LOC117178716 [Belonocnema kinseyi]|uniref:uncharacterized protein LOC117178716 n=1 Tax=Belonocnema kinseyi TaxID=2817044 RepID=UPI00143DC045|nr:uncharacterized protein LOC117178716 [Belonocnema kinseyi]
MEATNTKAFSLAREDNGFDKLSWSVIEKVFRTHFGKGGYEITVCTVAQHAKVGITLITTALVYFGNGREKVIPINLLEKLVPKNENDFQASHKYRARWNGKKDKDGYLFNVYIYSCLVSTKRKVEAEKFEAQQRQNNKILKRHDALMENRTRLDSVSSVLSEGEERDVLENNHCNKSKETSDIVERQDNSSSEENHESPVLEQEQENNSDQENLGEYSRQLSNHPYPILILEK